MKSAIHQKGDKMAGPSSSVFYHWGFHEIGLIILLVMCICICIYAYMEMHIKLILVYLSILHVYLELSKLFPYLFLRF